MKQDLWEGNPEYEAVTEAEPVNGDTKELAVIQPQGRTPMDLLSIALSKEAGIDVIERLAALQRETLARQAETEFNEAMNRVQMAIHRIAPDADNKATNSRYATYAAIDKIIRPIYSKEGFSLSFSTEECPKPETVRCICHVSRGGYTRKYQVDMPADGKGAKGGDVMTKTHATGAAMAYGMRYLVKGIFNIAVGAEDDDGNLMPENQEKDFLLKIGEADTLEELAKSYREAIKSAVANQDYSACKVFKEASRKREKELRA